MQIELNQSQVTVKISPQTMSYHFVARATSKPQQEAIVFEDTTITYGELYGRSQAIAAQLRTLGIKRQDKIGILYPNHPDFIAAFFAVVCLGAVVVPVNPMLKSEEISHILTDSGAKALIVHSRSLPEVMKALPAVSGLEHVIIASAEPGKENDLLFAPELKSVSLTEEKYPPRGCIFLETDLNPDTDLALIVYTSGTTGKPKGALITHGNVVSVLPDPLLAMFDIDGRDRCLGMLPLCHIYGIGVVMFGMLAKGGSIVVLPKFDAKEVLSTIERHRVTLIPAVPSMYQFMVMEAEKASYDLSSVRYCFSGAAPLSADLIPKVETAFGAKVIEGYALSETACGATINPVAAPKAGSIGKALPGVQVAIVSDEGWILPDGAENVGEIAVKGPNVMGGYHNQPEATAEVMRDEWFLTGDLGYRDVDGYLYIVGRKKEMIIRGGQNIYPREIEDVIARMPGVREVAVIGVPDDYMGERVKAIVVQAEGGQLTEDGVKEHCGQHLAPYKVPRLVEFRSEFLPRNSTGKVLKRLLS